MWIKGHNCVLECTGSVQGTGVDPTFRTAYMHPEKWNKAWFGLFQLQGGQELFQEGLRGC